MYKNQVVLITTFYLIAILITPACMAQTPTPSLTSKSNSINTAEVNTKQTGNANSNTLANSNSQANIAANPENSPNLTTVKVNKDGIELSGFPTWIIWVLLGVAVVGGIGFIWYLRNRHASTVSDSYAPLIFGIFIVLVIAALLLSIGAWWGRSAAREDFKQIIETQSISNQSAIPQQTPAPALITPIETTSVIQSLPFYVLLMLFLLLFLPECALFLYIYFRRELYSRYDDYNNRDRKSRILEEKMEKLEEEMEKMDYDRHREYRILSDDVMERLDRLELRKIRERLDMIERRVL